MICFLHLLGAKVINLQEFDSNFGNLKDKDMININCDFSEHVGDRNRTMARVSARRNILKNNSIEFICRDCSMTHKNPMTNRDAIKRQTDDEIVVICPDDRHQGDKTRKMKMSGYFGSLEQPYAQTCKSCAQLDKVISEEQKKKISETLTGIKRSDEFKQKLSDYIHSHPERLAQIKKTLTENRGSGMLGKNHSEETKEKMSEIMSGRVYTEEHKENISKGRKKMLDAQGGLLPETRSKLSEATIEQYKKGFNPSTFHMNGWFDSKKAGKIWFRSSYELKAMMKLDDDDLISSFKYEPFSIQFNDESGATKNYILDFEVFYKNGTKKWIEVKPASLVESLENKVKIAAGKQKASENSAEFEIWTEYDLFGHVYNKNNLDAFKDKAAKDTRVQVI